MNSPTLVTACGRSTSPTWQSWGESITLGFSLLSLPSTKAAGGSSTGEADGHETGAKRKRATCDTGDHGAGVKKKPATLETSDHEADVKKEYKYDAYEKLRPTRVRNNTGEVRVPFGNCVFLPLSSSIIPTSLRHTACSSHVCFLLFPT